LTRAVAEALAKHAENLAAELDKQVDLELGLKERAMGALHERLARAPKGTRLLTQRPHLRPSPSPTTISARFMTRSGQLRVCRMNSTTV